MEALRSEADQPSAFLREPHILVVDDVAAGSQVELEALALEEALEELEALDPRKARVVELRFFGGLTLEDAAESLGISSKTAEADWYMARAWLRSQLKQRGSSPA